MSLRSFKRFINNSGAHRNIRSGGHPIGPFWQKPQFSTTIKMSSIGGAGIGAGLYAAVSNPSQIAAQPEEAAAKAHHLKNGKGFTNPWDSYKELGALQIFWGIISYASSRLCCTSQVLTGCVDAGSPARQTNQTPPLPPSLCVHRPFCPPAKRTS